MPQPSSGNSCGSTFGLPIGQWGLLTRRLHTMIWWEVKGTCTHAPFSRTCLVVSNPVQLLNGNFEADLLVPEGVNSRCCINDILRFQTDTVSGRRTLQWNACRPAPRRTKYTLVDVRTQGHPGFYILHDRSCALTLERPQSRDLRVLELFAVGYGGWHRAFGFWLPPLVLVQKSLVWSWTWKQPTPFPLVMESPCVRKM